MKIVFNLTLINNRGYDMEEIKEVLTPEQYSKFTNWISGQTGEIYKDKFLIFKWDWERFCENELGIYHA